MGGSIQLKNHTDGGVHAEIEIPLAPLKAAHSS
jgi:hypothetical protein